MPQNINITIDNSEDRILYFFKFHSNIRCEINLNGQIDYMEKASKKDVIQKIKDTIAQVSESVAAGEEIDINLSYTRSKFLWLCADGTSDTILFDKSKHLNKQQVIDRLQTFCNALQSKFHIHSETQLSHKR